MKLDQIDSNFAFNTLPVNEKIEWIDANDKRLSLFGVFYDEQDGKFRRLPKQFADSVNPNIGYLSTNTAGGRVRFVTNSPFVAVKVVEPNTDVWQHMAPVTSHGISIYDGDMLAGMMGPDAKGLRNVNGERMAYQTVCKFHGEGEHSVTLYLPSYNGVDSLFVGVRDGSYVKPYDYGNKGKLVFYGSSITQGACASHPGNDYAAEVARWLDMDYLNLGFSGSARGEQSMAQYVANCNATAYVFEYDYNAITIEELASTHYDFYKTVRNDNPNVPIILMSRANYESAESEQRRQIILDTYERAVNQGDNKVVFVDGKDIYGNQHRECCTVDFVHPTDVGFYRMAMCVFDALKKIL